ncbi:hypothetical protein [Aeribacillus pallidus]|uniref:hypothetical protein n=1 Tax=Aeribacillus pallidus TaxID=33936 RepID=UPI003D20410B
MFQQVSERFAHPYTLLRNTDILGQGTKNQQYTLTEPKKKIHQISSGLSDIDDDWMAHFYEHGFETNKEDTCKKNAGESSILVLAFLLLHQYAFNIKQIAISTSDISVGDIKKNILDYSAKHQLLHVPHINPISFLSINVLLARAFQPNRNPMLFRLRFFWTPSLQFLSFKR